MHIFGKKTMKNMFAQEEGRCESFFRQSGPYWHVYTAENYPVFFAGDEDFRAGMTLIAICAVSFPSIRILAFQWMNNHLHIVLSGREEDIALFFNMLKRYLANYLKSRDRAGILDAWDYGARRIENLQDIRNAIAYVNRNGFLVRKEYSPYNYPWGANKCLFNSDYVERYLSSKQTLATLSIRDMFHTRDLDGFKGLRMLDGCVCPLVYCDSALAEGMFRDASHYFHSVSKNAGGMKEIAKEIGESVYYNDDELFTIVCAICHDQHGVRKPALLPASAKVEVARTMRFEYNAGHKQISRILKLDPALLDSILG